MTYYLGRMTHNLGCITHKYGTMTQNKSYVLSIQHHNCLISETGVSSGPMTQNKSYVLSNQHHNCLISETGVSSGPMTQNKSYVLFNQHHNRLISETDVSSKCSKSATVPIYVLLNYSNSQIDQKQHKIYKCSVLPLFLAIYHTIYVWMSQQEDKKCRNIGGIWPAIIT